MEKLVNKLENLNVDIAQRIRGLISVKGVESEFKSDIVLKIEDDSLMFNIGNYPTDSYLVEISEKGLISNYGHEYALDSISIENLCEVIDSFI